LIGFMGEWYLLIWKFDLSIRIFQRAASRQTDWVIEHRRYVGYIAFRIFEIIGEELINEGKQDDGTIT
jgi:hypothetical protein